MHPPPGVWAVRARLPERYGESLLVGVANIGFRPTVTEDRPEKPQVEVHLFDLDEDLYGAWMEVCFVGWIRGEERFDGVEALREQIAVDARTARELLAASKRPAGPSADG